RDMSRMIPHDRTLRDDRDDRAEDVLAPEEAEELADAEEMGGLDDDLSDDLDGTGEDDTALEGDAPQPADEAGERAEGDYASGPDDALGLYLRQMGAIPLLTRDRELLLARQLEHHRNRFRAAALLCPRVLARMLEKFEQIVAAQTPLDPNVDVYSS